MQAGFDTALTAIASVALFTLAIYSIVRGSEPPKGGWVEKYYRAEKNLGLVGNLFLLALCGFGLAKLARHFGLVENGLGATLTHVTEIVGVILAFAYLWLWLRARRTIKSSD